MSKRGAAKACALCGNPSNARGLCRKHYGRLERAGKLPPRLSPEERFWLKVQKTDTCWNWVASTNAKGYGQFNYQGRCWMAHRFAYQLANGATPPGKVLDHICHNRKCVNPNHLRAVTNKENEENRAGPVAGSFSGIRGVGWHKETQKWRGFVVNNGRYIHVGLFQLKEEAEAAVIAKRNELFTHNDLDRRTA